MAKLDAFPFDALEARCESRIPPLLPQALGPMATFASELAPTPTVLPAPPRVPSLLSFGLMGAAEAMPWGGVAHMTAHKDPSHIARPTLLDAPHSKLRGLESVDASCRAGVAPSSQN
jgi:hypothetical protein